ncbi:hypothetical protein GE21DRAFT_3557 [Neurospora crassa]|uniref:Uncharacterized protein n=1 Tax=Neurospora crassa (strain ATCC 24698 / 74-OR23-1A / CBS 708.71 / DSM 1257 / FGSC 987) TaxID=367110 RepID=Q7RUL5_NEUCR|nr:hypothetical protein NCU08470 [Neurospora crassa OR74A]EAA34076.2 hypothetical protein NCU08470 [Neurospora crassa OR74A]KHE80183.1 hypothetical protein GE21DRAFT_3557 [Neurospora crassa]|eukprot:XP_963312.2 hypothetical protein NCU08470 [Neurospora crassa OR74A]
MTSAAHSHSHELDGDSTWRTGDKPELRGESLPTAAATTPVKELPAQYSEPKELDSSVKPVELPVELPAEVHDDKCTTRDLSKDGDGVELIAELVELIVCLHEAYPHKNTKTWRFVTCQTLPESSFKTIRTFRPMNRSRMKAKTAAHLWLKLKEKSALNTMG